MKRMIVASALLLFTAGQAGAADGRTYSAFGGHAGITAIVDTFVTQVAGDSRINTYFGHTDITHLKAALVDQIGQVEGGPEIYKGRDMVSVHRNLRINQAAFNALAEDLTVALDTHHVPLWAQNDLLAKLAGLEPQVVTR